MRLQCSCPGLADQLLKDRVALPHMDIEGGEDRLESVGPLDLNDGHLVALDAEVEGILQPHIADPEPVSLALLYIESSSTSEPVDENSIWGRKSVTIVKDLLQIRVVRSVPISDKNSVVPSRVRERNWDSRPAEDPDPSKSTSSFLEAKRGEVVEATNLVLDLQDVCEVLSWGNWACCSPYSIFI